MAPTRTFDLRDVDEGTRSVRVVASTRAPVLGYEWNGERLIPRLEALESWNLERFRKNPVVLWSHDSTALPVGTADEIEENDDGLTMRVHFASARANPKADEVWEAVKEKLVRGVSVSWRYGERSDEERDAERVAVFRGNELLEVSLVPVPADADALVGGDPARAAPRTQPTDQPDGDPEDTRRKRVSQAGRELALARRRRTDADEVSVLRLDVGRLGKCERTQMGGIRVPARLTRTGVLSYRLPDGTTRRELRHPDEVFREQSLKTLASAPVTDHHPYELGGLVDPGTWRQVAIGHAENVRKDEGRFIAGELVIQDARAIDAIDRGEREDVSLGYRCRLEFTAGTWNGEPYDAVQRDITYNHVAILPRGVGRAGSEVGLRLDATDAVCVIEEAVMKVIKLDGTEYEFGSDAHIKKLEELHEARVTKLGAEHQSALGEVKRKFDETTGRLDAAETESKKLRIDLEAARDPKALAERVGQRVSLVLQARDILGDEPKLDAMTDREVMVEVIKADDRDFSAEGKSDDYVRGVFERALKTAARGAGIDAFVRAAELARRADASDPVTRAREENQKRNQEAYKQPLAFSKDTRG
jgi:HK97 family phage prohead protease